MLGNVIFFGNVEISKDDVYNSLILPSNILDESTKQCLEIIYGSLKKAYLETNCFKLGIKLGIILGL